MSNHTVIQSRLNILSAAYREFSSDGKAKFALWIFEADELSLYDSFFRRESSPGAKTLDLFLRFEVAFEGKDQYADALVNDLVAKVDAYNQEQEEAANHLAWKPEKAGAIFRTSPDYFFAQLRGFAVSLAHFVKSANVVAYLNPTAVSSWSGFGNWLRDAAHQAPDGVFIMAVDFEEQPKLSMLASGTNSSIKVLNPDLQVAELLKEVSQRTGNDQPGAVFQRHFIDLTKASSRGDFPAVEKHANLAEAVAIREDWKHLQVAVHNTVGTTHLQHRDQKAALTAFRKAEKIARLACEASESGAEVNLANTFFFQGTALINSRRYEEAAAVYAQAIPVLEGKDELKYSLFEAWRLSGQAYELAWQKKQATDAFWAAFKLSDELEDVQRKYSTLPYVGLALIRLSDHSGARYTANDIDQRLREVIGPDWRETIKSRSHASG